MSEYCLGPLDPSSRVILRGIKIASGAKKDELLGGVELSLGAGGRIGEM